MLAASAAGVHGDKPLVGHGAINERHLVFLGPLIFIPFNMTCLKATVSAL